MITLSMPAMSWAEIRDVSSQAYKDKPAGEEHNLLRMQGLWINYPNHCLVVTPEPNPEFLKRLDQIISATKVRFLTMSDPNCWMANTGCTIDPRSIS